MKQRLSAQERREQLLQIMQSLHQQAENQAEFTAEKVADEARISTVLLYRYVGPEFKALRDHLPGSHRPKDKVIRTLWHENTELHRQLREAQEKLRTTAVEELDEAILLIERLEEENLQLRAENKLLRKRLEEGGRVFVPLPSSRTSSHSLVMLNSGKEQTEGQEGQEPSKEHHS